ncbi:MAG: hypothetical protein GY749_40365 [Desulfobacteraceae bacterium]|nr:hypothetical protein [Desulfobacteraceae bacterium]
MKNFLLKARITPELMAKSLALILAVFILIRWWHYIDTYSVNILFWDQWDLYGIFIENKNPWELFRVQFGPHRQGIGFILTKIIADISGWNIRAEAFTIGIIVCGAMIFAFAVKVRLTTPLSWADAAIPLMFLTPIQYEIFSGASNLSHGSVPLLLLVLYSLAWTSRSCIFRHISVLIINFFLIYTGFGVFAGIITPVFLAIECLYAFRNKSEKETGLCIAAILISLLSAGSFFVGYTFSPCVGNFQFPIPQYWKYPEFIALALANFCGVKGVNDLSLFTGFIILFIMGGIGAVHIKRILKPDYWLNINSGKNISVVIVFLISFTLIFCANLAIGRVFLGMHAAQYSRYIPYIIPGYFAIYLHFAGLEQARIKIFLMLGTVICLIAATFPMRESDFRAMKWLAHGKTRWKANYLQTENFKETFRLTKAELPNFTIFPVPNSDLLLKKKLDYFKANKLNLYLDYPSQK